MIRRTGNIARRIAFYALTAIVILAFAYLCAMIYIEQSYRMNSRTVHARQITTSTEGWPLGLRVVRDFEGRHALTPEVSGGLRVYIDQWPSWTYLVSIQIQQDGRAKGAIRASSYPGKGPAYEREFDLDAADTSIFLPAMDKQVDGYWGAVSQCTDGTLYQFERWDNGRVTSGRGNAACQQHYAELIAMLGETLVTKLRDAPFDWRSWFYERQFLMMQGKGL